MSEFIWKSLALRELIALRVLFVLNLVWDFFLTVVIQSSMRSHVLLDFGAAFAPYIIILWIIVITGSILLFPELIKDPTERKYILSIQFCYIILISAVVLYLVLFIISILNILILWPIVVSYGMSLLWAGVLLYFKYQHHKFSIRR